MDTDFASLIDAMFTDEAPPERSGALASVAEMLAPGAPAAVWLADGGGRVIAAESDGMVEPAQLAAWSSGADEDGQDGDAGPVRGRAVAAGLVLIVAIRGGAGRVLGVLLRRPEKLEAAMAALGPALACCGRLALMAHDAAAASRQAEVRTRHLLAEIDTLRSSYSTTMASALEEREGRLREQREHVEGLERLVAERSADLRVAMERAQAASVSKSEFLANMSHEIRTPLTAILGYTDLLIAERRGEPTEKLEVISRNGRHLLELLNDILDISKIEAGRLEVERIACSPAEVVGDIAELMRARAEQKGLAFGVAFEGPVPETIQSDPTRLRQILMNLAGNAVKFTERGSVRLVVRLQEGPGRRAQGPAEHAPAAESSPLDPAPCALRPTLAFSVIDTGPGIAPEHQGRLFQPFSQADSSTTRKFGGTGLGLVISRRLAGMLGGDIVLQSSPGHGSTFTAVVETGPLDGVRMITQATRDPDPDKPPPRPRRRAVQPPPPRPRRPRSPSGSRGCGCWWPRTGPTTRC